MALKVGLTGGIGTGKSTVAAIFRHLSVPVLDADTLAKKLMQEDPELKRKIQEKFGEEIYKRGQLQNKLLAAKVFADPAQLQLLNSLVHPATIAFAEQWLAQASGPYAIKEAAIMLEAGSHTSLDVLIGVDAPEHLRISRVMQRDQVGAQQVRERMQQQMDNAEKMKHCDFVIINDENTSLIKQVLNIHEAILKQCKS